MLEDFRLWLFDCEDMQKMDARRHIASRQYIFILDGKYAIYSDSDEHKPLLLPSRTSSVDKVTPSKMVEAAGL